MQQKHPDVLLFHSSDVLTKSKAVGGRFAQMYPRRISRYRDNGTAFKQLSKCATLRPLTSSLASSAADPNGVTASPQLLSEVKHKNCCSLNKHQHFGNCRRNDHTSFIIDQRTRMQNDFYCSPSVFRCNKTIHNSSHYFPLMQQAADLLRPFKTSS